MSLQAVDIDGTPVHLIDADTACERIAEAACHHDVAPLAVVSVNLDHVHHFGASQVAAHGGTPWLADPGLDWLNLIDGSPIAHQVQRMTGTIHPKLSGSDLVLPVLSEASARHLSVGVIGGRSDVTAALRARFAAEWPGIRLAGHWTPSREELASTEQSEQIVQEIHDAMIDILLVCLGKPRQEQWIAERGISTGAGALLAFGAVVDFLAGRVSRAPHWISDAGLEWAWRLMLEPRRLAHRYLIDGPPAYLAVRRSTVAIEAAHSSSAQDSEVPT